MVESQSDADVQVALLSCIVEMMSMDRIQYQCILVTNPQKLQKQKFLAKKLTKKICQFFAFFIRNFFSNVPFNFGSCKIKIEPN